MAIIYETKEDFERDKLKDQVKDVSLKAEKQAGIGLSLGLGGAIIEQFNGRRDNPSKGWSYASVALSLVGLVEIVKSLFTHGKSHDLKLQHDRMGPQVSVIPTDAKIPTMPDDCPICHKHTANIQPTTLLEQAAKQDIPLVR